MAPTPMPKATPKPTSAPPGDVLPFDSTLLFVLDDPISSKGSKSGTFVHAHLKEPIVVAGQTIAAAGTPAQIKILNASPSGIMDVYGFVDIYFEPLQLPDGRIVPLRTPLARLSTNVSSGHESTVSAEDTAGDIFVPYYPLWQILRKGKNFVLEAGSVLPANTEATISAGPRGTISIVTPHPMAQSTEPANATFPVLPLATPFGPAVATPRPRTTPAPPTPSPSLSPPPTP
jgi:hypothetical protein